MAKRPSVEAVLTEEVQPVTPEEVSEVELQLLKLRDPFPPEMIEKLPKPLWGGAWDGGTKGQCSICNGYHVLANTLHLDYVGHANTTNRLLEVDPFWDWDFLFKDERGMPIYSDGGLWITLTVCGVTRKGFGDGKNAKEIIGDAIRNAAMRFGVALDLWSKIDLHGERNPGGQAQAPRHEQPAPRQAVRQRPNDSADPPRAANQDALDSLGAVCDENGYDKRWVAERYESDFGHDIRTATADDILAFAALLIEEAITGPPEEGAGLPGGGEPEPEPAGEPVGSADEPASGNPEENVGVPADPVPPDDLSDVEPKPGDMF